MKNNEFSSFTFCSGETGAGKTSTANHLMGTNLETSDKVSTTTHVISFSRTSECTQLGFGNLKMNLVDTPGLNDTHGIEQDACNMHALKMFCDRRVRVDGKKMFPNIILLCVPSTENRVLGEESKFAKNLRTLKSMGVIDTERPNIVVVVTHACSLPHKNVKTWTDKKSKIQNMFKEVFKQVISKNVPVVFMENEYSDQELERDGVKGTLLPDGESHETFSWP